jgi:hypothetical protein
VLYKGAEKNIFMRSFIVYILTKYYLDNQIKGNDMGWACSAHGKIEMHTKFWLGSLKGRDHLEDLAVEGRMILIWILEKWCWRIWIGFV